MSHGSRSCINMKIWQGNGYEGGETVNDFETTSSTELKLMGKPLAKYRRWFREAVDGNGKVYRLCIGSGQAV